MRKIALVTSFFPLVSGALAQTLPDDLLSLLQANPVIPEFLLERASLFLEAALTSGALSVEEATELLKALHWSELGEEEIGFAVRALELALIAFSTGNTAVTEALNRLSQAVAEGVLGPLASESKALSGLPGLASSLLKLAVPLNPELWSKIENLAAAKVPLGLIGHTVRELAKSGADAAEITKALAELTPPGRAQVREHLKARENFGAPETEEEEKVPPKKGGKKK